MSVLTASALRRFVQPIVTKLRLLISRGEVKLVDDSKKMQALQVELLEDELHDEIEHFQEFGFTSHPLEGAEVLYLSVGANRDAGVVVCVSDRRFRPKNMAPGDVCLYTEDGERVYLNKADDVVHIGAKAAAEFIAQAAKTDTAIQNLQVAFDAHIHTTTATVGPSGVPGVIAKPSPVGAQTSVAATKAKVT